MHYDEDATPRPGRMWSDDQLRANTWLVAMLQNTQPPVGLHAFSTTTRFVYIVEEIAKILGIERASRLFVEALVSKMGYDYDKILENCDEVDCRSEGV